MQSNIDVRSAAFKKNLSDYQSILIDFHKRLEEIHRGGSAAAVKKHKARNTLYKACWLKDEGKPYSREAAIAKLYCSEIAREVADESLQIHGGYGLIKGTAIERFYRDQRLLQIGEGTSEILRLVISRKLGV